jgi:transitional endoplasmic reticulum ATPase
MFRSKGKKRDSGYEDDEEPITTMIHHRDFLEVLDRIKPSITLRMLEDYERLKLDFSRKMHKLERAERKEIISWEDVGGLEEVKMALREYVELPLTQPKLLEDYKLKTAKGILLFGPPGCGKTHVMRAASNMLKVPIQIVNGPEIVNAIVGQTEAAVREVLTRARENAPSIVFIDEIDAFASKESMKTPEVSRGVSQFLTELDGLRPRDKVIVVATTNRPMTLDPALLRPGRLDKIFYVPPPDFETRKAIFAIHLRDVPLADFIDIATLAHLTEGYSGADISAIVEEAKHLAVRQHAMEIEQYRMYTQQLIQYYGAYGYLYTPPLQYYPPSAGIKMKHLQEALSKIRSSITPETIRWCKEFLEKYGTR